MAIRLMDVCEMIPGFAFKSKDFGEFPDKVIKITQINPPFIDLDSCLGIDISKYDKNKLEKYKAKIGDFCFAMTGATLGKIGKITSGEAYLNQRVLMFKPLKNIDKKYLYYSLLVPEFNKYVWNHIDSDSAQPNISAQTLGKYELNLPPLSIQRKIASILSAIDDKIELNNRMNENLEKIIQTIYKEWFNYFNPWNGVMPKEWSIGSIVSNPFSTVIKPGVDVFDEKTYYATADINGLSLSEGKTINYHSRETRANMQPTNNSVWFAKMKNSIKHLILNDNCNNFINNSILSTGFCGIQCTPESFEYIATYIRNPSFEIEKDHRAHGTTQEAVNLDDLNKIEMIIPTDDVLKEFHNQTNHLYLNITKNQIENKRLSELRDTLLPKLMSGEIDVDKVEL